MSVKVKKKASARKQGPIDRFGMVIGGKKTEAASGAVIEVENPATGEIIATVPAGGEADVQAAFNVAAEAAAGWGRTSVQDRFRILVKAADILERRIDEFVRAEVAQTGRAIREMRAQLARTSEWYSYFAAVARTHESHVHPFGGDYLNYTRRMPLGVVGLITPWNHPLLILTKKVAPALAAGNTMVVKPSEVAPLTPLMLADVFSEAGLPDGVYNVVTGYGTEAGKAVSEHPGFGKIDLTGGTETGRIVSAAAGGNLVPFAGELGGKAAVIAFDDSDIERIVSAALFAAFIASGQTCVQGARLLVQSSIHDAVLARLVERANRICVGDPFDPATQMGPLVSAGQLALTQKYVAIGLKEGARLVCGGKRMTEKSFSAGYFHEPTIFADVTPDMRIVTEEIFGPVLTVTPFTDEAEAIEIANATPFGLSSSVWTSDLTRAHRVSHAIEAGIVWINDHHRIDPSSPWGGFKLSGIGKENGIATYESYTKVQSVVANLSDDHFDWFTDDNREKRYS